MAKRHNGEGSLYQRADGMWIGSVSEWKDGKRVRHTVSSKRAEDARAKLKALQRTIDDGLNVPNRQVTLDMLLDRWFRDVLPNQVASPALSNYRFIVDGHIRPTLGKRPVAKITIEEIDRLLADKRRGDPAKKIKPLSVSTVRRIRSVLAAALDEGMRWKMVGTNAARLSRAPRAAKLEGKGLEPADAKRFLAGITGHPREALFVLMIGTGLRRGEALALKWTDVDLTNATLTVRYQLRREDGGGLVLVEPKTAKSRRAVNLPALVVAKLREQKAQQATERLKVGPAWRDTGHVFTTGIGTPLDPRNVSREFVDAADKAGVGKWHIHELRHSAASLMLNAGVPIEVVSDLLGHASIRITSDVYAHIAAPARHAAAETIDAVLGS